MQRLQQGRSYALTCMDMFEPVPDEAVTAVFIALHSFQQSVRSTVRRTAEQRQNIKFCFKLGKSEETHEMLVQVYGQILL